MWPVCLPSTDGHSPERSITIDLDNGLFWLDNGTSGLYSATLANMPRVLFEALAYIFTNQHEVPVVRPDKRGSPIHGSAADTMDVAPAVRLPQRDDSDAVEDESAMTGKEEPTSLNVGTRNQSKGTREKRFFAANRFAEMMAWTRTSDGTEGMRRARPPLGSLISSYDELSPSRVSPKTLDALPQGRQLSIAVCSRLHQSWIKRYHDFRNTVHLSHEQDLSFREVVWLTLQLVIGFPNHVTLAKRNIDDEYGHRDWQREATLKEGRVEIEVMPLFGSRYHLPGNANHHAPTEDFYWFRAVLVLPLNNICHSDVAKAGVAKIVAEGSKTGRASFHGVVISMSHVVLVRVSQGGRKVEHSDVLVLSQELDRLVNCNDPDINQDDYHHLAPGFNVRSTADEIPVNRSLDAFAALAHLFEAAMRDRLKPATSPNLPIEVLKMILTKTDRETRLACEDAARFFRDLSQQQCIVTDDGIEINKAKGYMWFGGPNGTPQDLVPIVGDTPGKRTLLFQSHSDTPLPDIFGLRGMDAKKFHALVDSYENGELS
ncbi:hypothetical protein KVT40_000479 [Elsinoe batatas]|uniref:Uncharacterized protein n=1 Tax=Elsinoe batatas TaxID=2601811 RepID=A0A8K0L7U4_9PEZI|nr:hypothetical protein KVT40_000479 [Elsinoe batatas]